MRRLVVIRHAKAQRSSPRGDHGRELSDRGRAQALALRNWTEAGGALSGLRGTVVVSDAARTLETFALGLAGTPSCTRAIVEPSLYIGSGRDVTTRDVLFVLRSCDPGFGDLFVVGHSPTVAEVVFDLVADRGALEAAGVDDYPLCGVAVLTLAGEEPTVGTCGLEFFGAPEVA